MTKNKMTQTQRLLAASVEDWWGSRGDRGVAYGIDGYADIVVRTKLDRDELRGTERIALEEALKERIGAATASIRVLIDAAVDTAIEDLLVRYPEARAAEGVDLR